MKTISFKRGTSFGAAVRFVVPVGSSFIASEVVVTSEVRTAAGTLVAALTITPDLDGLGFYAEAPGGTSAWPLGPLQCDFKLNVSGQFGASETMTLNVVREVTR